MAGYAEAMNLVFASHADISITENHIKQLHLILLSHSEKDDRHRGEYKKLPNNVEAFDAEGKRTRYTIAKEFKGDKTVREMKLQPGMHILVYNME